MMGHGFGRRQPLLFVNFLLAAFIGGALFSSKGWVALLMVYPLLFLVLAYLAAVFLLQRDGIEIGLVFLFLLLGAMRFLHDAALPADDISAWRNKTLLLAGEVTEPPVIKERPDGMYGVKYTLHIETARQKGQDVLAKGKILVYTKVKEPGNAARIGDKIAVSGRVREIHGYRNPGLYDSEAALRRQGITAKLFAAKSGAEVQRAEGWFFRRFIGNLRKDLLAAMERVMPPKDAAALFAMLFGGYGGIEPELLEAFTATGIVHILSVSGSHIALLAAAMAQFGRLLRFRPIYTAAMASAAVIFYGAFCGFVPPVLRSSLMGILAFGASALGRENDGKRLLSMTALGMLIAAPQLIFDISFQLSFGATAGLLYLSAKLRDLLVFLPRWLAENLSLTIAAQLGVLPFLAWYFNTVSISSLLANLIAVPVVEYIIIAGLLASALGMALPFLQQALFVLCSLALGLVYRITVLVASLPGGSLYLPSGGTVLGAVYYMALFLWAGGYPRAHIAALWPRCFSRKVLGGLLFCLLAAGGFALWRAAAPEMAVHFIDVGQGDAALFITPHHQAVLIDTGGVLGEQDSFDVGERVVVPYLRHYGIREVEFLVLTHAHADHAGGAAAVCRRLKVNHILIGREDRQAYAKAFRTSLKRMPECIPMNAGQEFWVDGVCFAAAAAEESAAMRTGNETSAVIRASYGTHSFLITGDLSAEGEKDLLEKQTALQSTVLKVGHHGSKSSSSEEFLRTVRPQYAIISVGADNSFGHPADAVLRRLAKSSAKVYRTDKDGAVVFTSDGKNLKAAAFMEGR